MIHLCEAARARILPAVFFDNILLQIVGESSNGCLITLVPEK